MSAADQTLAVVPGISHLLSLQTIPVVRSTTSRGHLNITVYTPGELSTWRDLLDHTSIADATDDAITIEGSLRGLRVFVHIPHWQEPGVGVPSDAWSAFLGDQVANNTSGVTA